MAKVFRPEEAHPQFRLCESHMRVLRHIARNPGCCKYDAAKAGTYSSMRNPSRQYYLVNTLIRHGYIIATKHGNRYSLGLSESSYRGEESNHIAGLTTDVI